MDDVFCIFAGANEPIGEPEQRRSVLQIQGGEGVRASGPCLSDQGRWAPVPGARAHAITRMPLAGKTLRTRGVAPSLPSGLSLWTQVVYLQPTGSATRVGRRQVNPAAPGSPGRSGARSRRAEMGSARPSLNAPPRATLTGDPQRLCNTHLSPPSRRPGPGARTTTVPAFATPARPAA